MVLKVFSVYDSKAATYNNPVMFVNAATAIRALEQNVNDPNSDFSKFAEDFTLFEIGTWDDQEGRYEMYGTKINLGGLWQMKAKSQEARMPRGPAPDLVEPIRPLMNN